MISETLLVGCVLGFLVVIFREFSSQQRRQTRQKPSAKKESIVNISESARHFVPGPWGLANITRLRARTMPRGNLPRHNLGGYDWRRVTRRRTLHVENPEFFRLEKTRDKKGNTLVETWRKSIVGLVKLADRNLQSARQHLTAGNYRATIQTASTSVENIARALIHCCGDKPDSGSGQEEALRILSRRFEGEGKIEFEKALDKVARISHNRIVLKYTSRHNVQTQLFDETRTRQILESASKIVSLFKRIITEHFGEEIPELLSTKTKLDSMCA